MYEFTSNNQKEYLLTEDSTSQYMREMSKFDVLSLEEEQTLFSRLAAGDEDARNKIINANLRLVIRIAKSYYKSGIAKLDLIQEGNIGLIKATYKFDINRGLRFSTFATYCIKQEITHSLSKQGYMVYIPDYAFYELVRVNSIRIKLEQQLSREVTVDELAEAANIPLDRLKDYLNVVIGPLSLDATMDEDGTPYTFVDSSCVVDTYHEVIHQNPLRDTLEAMLGVLTDKEADIVRLRFGYFGKGLTLEEIGVLYNVSRERIRQIEKMALIKLRREKNLEQLECFLID